MKELIRVLKRILTKEVMLELLTYEPYKKLVSEEEEYIQEILAGNDNPPPSLAKFHELFLGFYDYYIQCKKLEDAMKTKNAKKIKTAEKAKDAERSRYISKLRQWKATYGCASLRLLFKKICFYLMVKEGFSESDFMAQIGSHVSRIRPWGISPQFRKYAEAGTYSTIRSSRNGIKKPYIVALVKKLYYEAGRQESNSMTLNKLPTFVDVFTGTGSVAASVVSEGCPSPIVNDFDPVMICFVWAFTHRKNEMCKRIAEYHNYLMKLDFESTNWPYDANAYNSHNDTDDLETTPEAWEDPKILRTLIEFYGYSEEAIARNKELAQCHKKFIIRTRSSYMAVKDLLDSCDRDALRKKVDFNKISSHSIAQISDVLYYALLVFYYYSFEPGGPTGNVYYPTIVNTSSYSLYLDRLKVSLDSVRREKNKAIRAKELMALRLEPSSLNLEFNGHFSRYLQDAKCYCKDFSEILKDDPFNKIYYLDSPYFLTVGYDVGFFDDKHIKMLDLLRDAKFKWIFSMQYNPFDRSKCTSASEEKKRRSQSHIIKDYESYFRGFYAPFQLESDQRTYYVPTDAPMEAAENLYVILFDFDKVKEEWSEMKNTKTREMLVVNFNPLRTIPLHDSAVVYPFDLFLKCANEKKDYPDIVKRAVAWRKSNIESKYVNEVPV